MGRVDRPAAMRSSMAKPTPIQARGAERRGGQLSPGCEPRSRRSRADHRRLRPRIRTPLDPHVADPPSLRSCRCGSSPSRRACRRPWHAGIDAVSVSPAAVRSVGASVAGAIRTSAERPQARGRLLPACNRLRLPTRQNHRRPPAYGGSSVRRFLWQTLSCLRPLTRSVHQSRPHDHNRCSQPPCSRLPGTADRAAGVDFTLGRCYEYLPTRAGGSF